MLQPGRATGLAVWPSRRWARFLSWLRGGGEGNAAAQRIAAGADRGRASRTIGAFRRTQVRKSWMGRMDGSIVSSWAALRAVPTKSLRSRKTTLYNSCKTATTPGVMSMNDSLTQQYLKHIESIIRMYEEAEHDSNRAIPDGIAYGIIARSKTTVEKITGINSHYTKDIFAIIDDSFHTSYKVELIIGILTALKGDLADGHLTSLSELIHGETFNSYLDMAEYLLVEGYKDAAAVIAGSTLEVHFRQFCARHGIDA